MKRSHSFRYRAACGKTGEFIDVLIIFFGRAMVDKTVIDDEVQNAQKSREPSPDAIILLGYGESAEKIKTIWESNPDLAGGLYNRGNSEKIAYLKELSIWKFFDGDFKKIYKSDASKRDYDVVLESALTIGLSESVDNTRAYQSAPPGHIFKHPSQRHSKHFFLASQLLIEEIDAYFVALVVCTKAWPSLKNSTAMHIDTMGIYPIARAIEDIARQSGGVDTSWTVANFHSHVNISELYEGIGSTAVVLVSASTSGGMANRLKSEGVASASIITLLDMTRKDRSGTVIYARDEFIRTEKQQPSSGEAVIELAGEYFAATGKKPRALTLTIKHEPPSLAAVLKHFSHKDFCRLNSERLNGESISDLLSLNENLLVQNKKFLEWVKEELRAKTPVSVSHIIFGSSDGSRELAKFCASEISIYSCRTPSLVTSDDIATIHPSVCTGVLICAPVVGDGHRLRTIARDLREIVPAASRHFLVGVGLPRTVDSWDRLDKFLVRSASRQRPYLFSYWQMLPVGGMPIRESKNRVDELMQQLEHMVVRPQSPWQEKTVEESCKLLADLLEKEQGFFLPTIGNSNLLLTDGFVYWNSTDEQRKNCDPAAVSYLAMSSALQSAREYSDLKMCLSSTLHETVVLDTENFLRFNDATLQASLLRAALPHELNYSGAAEQSQVMREFLEKIFLNADKPYGDAAQEFALALATGTLQLTSKDKSKLIEKIAPTQTKPSSLVGLLYAWWSPE